MSASDAGSARRCLLIHLCILVAAIALEIHFYPSLATFVDGLFGGQGGPGSSMGYFRDHYVLPAGFAFAVLAITGLSLAASRSHKSLHRASVIVCIANLAAILVSSTWYFYTTRAAAGYRG
jgi:hypothetical protein